MTTTDTIAALCRAIDAGDDEVLLILADALGEVGDPRAPGLRRVGDKRPRRLINQQTIYCWVWIWIGIPAGYGEASRKCRLPGPVFSRMTGNELPGGFGHYLWYASRSTAFLALAAALAGEPPQEAR